MQIPRRQFLHLAASAAAIPALSSPAVAQTTPPRSSRARLEDALARIADPSGEGARACLTVYSEASRVAADASDARARVGITTLGPLDGSPQDHSSTPKRLPFTRSGYAEDPKISIPIYVQGLSNEG
jgi:hypothetical protein